MSAEGSVICKTIILKENLDEGIPGPEHFAIDEKPFPLNEKKIQLSGGSIIVEVKAISADPYLRGTMKSGGNSLGSTRAGNAMVGYVSGKVIATNNSDWTIGDFFGSCLPFSTYQVVDQHGCSKSCMWKLSGLIDEKEISRGIGILGMPGSTAYGGFIDILQPKRGETLFVSAASGAVGGLVGMIAKHVYGCKVIGSCGGEEKCNFIRDYYGFDHAIDYKKASSKEDLIHMLKEVAPDGIDMYFENVGGIHFEASVACLRRFGRIAICGWISGYNEKDAPTATIFPSSMNRNQQKIEGFLCNRWLFGETGNFLQDMNQWIKEGKVKVQETTFEGIENWPIAFQSLFTGKHLGKVVVLV
jgi:NADPH-dependent curcumin reductase CurA